MGGMTTCDRNDDRDDHTVVGIGVADSVAGSCSQHTDCIYRTADDSVVDDDRSPH